MTTKTKGEFSAEQSALRTIIAALKGKSMVLTAQIVVLLFSLAHHDKREALDRARDLLPLIKGSDVLDKQLERLSGLRPNVKHLLRIGRLSVTWRTKEGAKWPGKR